MSAAAGDRWRLLVHDAAGVSHDVRPVPDERAQAAREQLGAAAQWTAEHIIPGRFDELVAGGWLHVEEMGNDADDGSSTWWMSVAGIVLFVDVAADGSPTGLQFYAPGEYDDPVPGVTYSGVEPANPINQLPEGGTL